MLNTKYLGKVTFDAVSPCSKILASIVYAVQCSYHSTLQATTERLVFGGDVLLGINLKKHYKETWLRKQKIINNYNICENEMQVQHDYEVGHYAYILRGRNYRKV